MTKAKEFTLFAIAKEWYVDTSMDGEILIEAPEGEVWISGDKITDGHWIVDYYEAEMCRWYNREKRENYLGWVVVFFFFVVLFGGIIRSEPMLFIGLIGGGVFGVALLIQRK